MSKFLLLVKGETVGTVNLVPGEGGFSTGHLEPNSRYDEYRELFLRHSTISCNFIARMKAKDELSALRAQIDALGVALQSDSDGKTCFREVEVTDVSRLFNSRMPIVVSVRSETIQEGGLISES
jgi:hypothetical protein